MEIGHEGDPERVDSRMLLTQQVLTTSTECSASGSSEPIGLEKRFTLFVRQATPTTRRRPLHVACTGSSCYSIVY